MAKLSKRFPAAFRVSADKLQSVPDEEKLAEVTPLAVLERQAILDALEKTGGDRLLAAELLGIGKTTIYRKLQQYKDAGLI